MERELIAQKKKFRIKGAIGGFRSVLAALMFNRQERDMLLVCTDQEEAEHIQADLLAFLDAQQVFLWKDSNRRPFQQETFDLNKQQSRTAVLDQLSDRTKSVILVSYPEALAEKVVDQHALNEQKLVIKRGEELDLDYVFDQMHDFEFEREDFVYEPGQFAVRGGIVDVFSFASEWPIRIELDGRRIESIREFDPVSQLSARKLDRCTLVPNLKVEENHLQEGSVLDYMSKATVIMSWDLPLLLDQLEKAFGKYDITNCFDAAELKDLLQGKNVIEYSAQTAFRSSVELDFSQQPQPSVNKHFDLLIQQWTDFRERGFVVPVFSESHKQIERLESIFDDIGANIEIHAIYKNLSSGFVDPALKVACYTEHQIFNRYYKVQQGRRVNKASLTLKELTKLKPGDFVVHIDHGVGEFQGLQRMEMGGKVQDAVRIKYKNNDLLYVNIGALHKISKFKGQEGQDPKLNKLGSDAWKKLKSKTKKKVKDIARDLIKLYAKRKKAKGHAYPPDTYLQTELEASFMYEDTPDQARATEEVKRDLEQSSPMDRLLCGDVGFGKTEIAIRAAFKAVTDSKQVAVLVPTTILAQQHYHTFRDRLADFPCRVDYINRFRTSKQQKDTLEALASGKVDIIIGTHRLLNKNIKFKDLGLLIIDEEQKFGVSSKERLKSLRTNVDTLTLTATPIPRTLHFSLMGARDLSIIQTPPPNRRPVQTEVHVWNNELIADAVEAELDRGGQVFFVHNRVKDIREVALKVSELVPRARVAVGHGQMKGDELEQVMVQFIEGEFDVLVATTIIESGLDIPNANTIIINNAHMFGLSDLHQMRGRVGRSNQKAYCYLLAPPVYSLPEDGRRRLQAIEEYADLGSGFNVAMRDLDIRGAGNLLGAEQSGFISEIGFQMYHKILDEAIQELREEEFGETVKQARERDCSIEPDFEAFIPDQYVNNVAERIALYTRLSQIKDSEELEEFKGEVRDRFGEEPKELQDLYKTIELKLLAGALGIEKVKIKGDALALYFHNELGDTLMQSGLFDKIMEKVRKQGERYQLKQGKEHLILIMKGLGHWVSAFEQLDSWNNLSQNGKENSNN